MFEAPKEFTPFNDPFTDVRNPKWYEYTGIQLDKNGMVPFYRYVIRKKGTIEVNLDSCAECHSRLMPDGTVIKGAQGNVPFGKILGYRLAYDSTLNQQSRAKPILTIFWGAPWIQPDPIAPLGEKTVAEFVQHLGTIPQGVNVRQGTSVIYPAQIPDLIGVQDRLYLDHTGLQQHRSIADLMRYDAINNFIEEVTDYNRFQPASLTDSSLRPNRYRESDLELYALALFLYF